MTRLLITRHDKIGDFVLALPLCKAIKAARPEVSITVLVSKVNFEFAKMLPFIDDVILYSQDSNETLAQIRARRFEASISCFIDSRLGLLLWRAGIPRRIAPATKAAQVFFNERVSQRRSLVEKTEWQYNLDLGYRLLPTERLSFTPPLIRFENLHPQNRVVFHPGFGGSSDGNLKIEDYLMLARLVLDTVSHVEVVFTFGPDDDARYEQVKALIDFPATLVKSTLSLFEFCKFLAGSRLFISTSTGPMHLAGAVNIPSISFFGQSLFASSKRWATVSNPALQHNFMVGASYSPIMLCDIKAAMVKVLTQGPAV